MLCFNKVSRFAVLPDSSTERSPPEMPAVSPGNDSKLHVFNFLIPLPREDLPNFDISIDTRHPALFNFLQNGPIDQKSLSPFFVNFLCQSLLHCKMKVYVI